MELNPHIHDMVTQERRADDIRRVERWRLIKSLEEHASTPRWLQRLGLGSGRRVPVDPEAGAAKSRPESRRTATSPAH